MGLDMAGQKKAAKAGTTQVPVDSEVTAYVRSELARDAFSRYTQVSTRRSVVFMGIPLVMSMAMNVMQATRRPQTRFIPTDTNGRILPLVTLDKPVASDDQVAQWATDIIQRAFTMDYVNYRKQLSGVEGEFTGKGWKDFETMLVQSSFLDTLTSNSYVTTATVTDAPQVLTSGLVQDGSSWIYAWKIRVALHIVFRNSTGPSDRSYQVDVLVIRQPQTHEAVGLGIAQIIAQ